MREQSKGEVSALFFVYLLDWLIDRCVDRIIVKTPDEKIWCRIHIPCSRRMTIAKRSELSSAWRDKFSRVGVSPTRDESSTSRNTIVTLSFGGMVKVIAGNPITVFPPPNTCSYSKTTLCFNSQDGWACGGRQRFGKDSEYIYYFNEPSTLNEKESFQ